MIVEYRQPSCHVPNEFAAVEIKSPSDRVNPTGTVSKSEHLRRMAMKPLAALTAALSLHLGTGGVTFAQSASTPTASETAAEQVSHYGLTLFYKPGQANTPVDVSVDGARLARLYPGETINLLPLPGPVLVEVAAASGRKRTWKSEIHEAQSKGVVIELTAGELRLGEQRRALAARYDKVFAFDGEDSSWVDISPPPANALRRSDNAADEGIRWASPKSWPVRVLFISGHALYEFDDKGNVVRMDGKQPSRPISVKQEWKNNKPTWSNGAVYQLVSGDAPFADKVESARTFVLTKRGMVCPAKPIGEAYRLRYEIASPIFSGDCDKAVQWRRSGTPLWAYASDLKRGWRPALLWNVQYFRDPVRPLLDLKGNCLYGCSSGR